MIGQLKEIRKEHGTGLYGLGTILTFLWLEIGMFYREFSEGGVWGVITDRLFDFGFDTMFNMIMAGAWPVYWGIKALEWLSPS